MWTEFIRGLDFVTAGLTDLDDISIMVSFSEVCLPVIVPKTDFSMDSVHLSP